MTDDPTPRIHVAPCFIGDARRYVAAVHRHNLPPKSGLFAVAIEDDTGARVGVGIAGRPVARALDDGHTIEITRVATDGHPNACSMIYGALCRAAKALGYRRAITYTIESEPGTSLKAAGFSQVADLRTRPSWGSPSRPRVQVDLFGNERRHPGPKRRWQRMLA